MLSWTLAIAAAQVPDDALQLVLVEVVHFDDSIASLTRWSRDGTGWRLEGSPIPARVGAKGSAWGRGLHPTQPGVQKVEGDLRAPAGIFRLGALYGDVDAPEGTRWPYVAVGPRDLWVEDATAPTYNTHFRVPGIRPLTPWEESQRMKLGDPAHALKLAVLHNAPPEVVAGAGSAIFVHSWRRDGEGATAGCTAMQRSDLDRVLTWLEPAAAPVLVLLTAEDRARFAQAWSLPVPTTTP